MSGHFTGLDGIVLLIYFAGTMSIGFFFYRKSRSTEGFTAASRSLPGWACGLSIFATYLSSISFLALPGKAYAANWNPFVFSLSLPLATWIAVRFFLPYYRRTGEVSAYAHLEHRFGPWARGYVSLFYLLTQLARMGVVMYLIALSLSVLLGWNIIGIILLTGISVTIYAFVGGIVAVIWADALQAIVLMIGAAVCSILMLFYIPEGPGQIFTIAAEHRKFSLGGFDWSWTAPTFWVVLVYGVVINLQNFGIDQNYIQRYIASRCEKEARKSIWLGGLLYLPVSAVFFFIGTELFAFYSARPEYLAEVKQIAARQALLKDGLDESQPEYEQRMTERIETLKESEIGDSVFPHFIGRMLPRGITGLLIAAIFAAGMSTVSTSLNSSATLLVTDWYKRYFNRQSTERQSMAALYTATVVWGILGTMVALVMVNTTGNILDVWWNWAGILSGGMLGLFLLGLISRKANNAVAIISVLQGLFVIAWITLSVKTPSIPASLQWHVHEFLIPVLGVASILFTGLLLSCLYSRLSACRRSIT
ncbi:MAG: sodium:solute symporter [Sedimentisphaerales bacterium]|nr:sodium:solute symporter [Sedimentisphaerales bacterium]